jgi:predicted metal-dependent hydrolase
VRRGARSAGAKSKRAPTARRSTTYALALRGVEFPVTVTKKSVRRLTLRVHPPDGDVRVTSPQRLSESEVRSFVHDHLDWIRKHRDRIRALPRPAEPAFEPGEIHFVAGAARRLVVRNGARSARVTVGDDDTLVLSAPAFVDAATRARALERFYRESLRAALPPLVALWEPRMGVRVAEWGVKRMKTRWGSCNPRARRIWLNLALAKRRHELLEYVVVHEMAHIHVADHGPAFQALMTQHLPAWRSLRRELNAWPTWAAHPPNDAPASGSRPGGEHDPLDQEPDA